MEYSPKFNCFFVSCIITSILKKMTIQARLNADKGDLYPKKIPRKYSNLSPVEKFYKSVKIIHKDTILFPGRFGKKKNDCGQFNFSYSCDCGGLVKNVYKSCNNVNCPNCYTNVLRRSKKRITKKSLKVLELLKTSGKKKFPHFNHIMFGPKPTRLITENNFDYLVFKKFKRKYLRIIKKYKGSGVLFFHAYRKKVIKIETAWKTNPNREKVRETTVLRFSPHFHLIGNIWIPENHYRNEGFVIRKIKNKETNRIIKIYKESHLHSVIGYLLTHTTYYEGTKMSSWIGEYSSYYVKKINERTEYEYVICEKCEEYAYRILASPFDIDDNFYYYTKYWKSSLDFDNPLRKKHEIYELIKK